MNEFVIKIGVPMPTPCRRGRKHGSKDSRKFANRGRPQKSGAVRSAVDTVRKEQCSIEAATHRFFDSYIESKRTTTEAERKNDGRFNEFQIKIVDELKRNPLDWKARKALAELHSNKTAKYPRYRKKVREIQQRRFAFFVREIDSIPVVKLQNELKSVESDE